MVATRKDSGAVQNFLGPLGQLVFNRLCISGDPLNKYAIDKA